MTITIPPGLEAEVQVQARAEGLPVEAYIERLIREKLHFSRVDADEAAIDESDPQFAGIQAAVTEGLEQFERGEGRSLHERHSDSSFWGLSPLPL